MKKYILSIDAGTTSSRAEGLSPGALAVPRGPSGGRPAKANNNDVNFVLFVFFFKNLMNVVFVLS